MREPAGEKRNAWFWVGMALLLLSVVAWLLVILVIVDEPEGASDILLAGAIITAIPIGMGIYCVRRSRRLRVKDASRRRQLRPLATSHATGWKRGLWFWVGMTLLSITALVWMLYLLVPGDQPDKGATIVGFAVFTIVPLGIGLFCLGRGFGMSFWDMWDWIMPIVPGACTLVLILIAILSKKWYVGAISLISVLATVLWVIIIVSRRQVALQEGEELIQHLQGLGVRAAWAEPGTEEEKIGANRLMGWRPEGVIKIADRSIVCIVIMSRITASTWLKSGGIEYFFDYLIKCPGWQGSKQEVAPEIRILPERKHGYVKIRTPDTLPSASFFSQLGTLAEEIRLKSGGENIVYT